MRRKDVQYSSLPCSPSNQNGKEQGLSQLSQDDNQQSQGQEAEKENRIESQKEIDSFCNDYIISQNHNVKPSKKNQHKNLTSLKTRYPSPSPMGGGIQNHSLTNYQPSSTPINMNRIAGTSVYDCRNQRMELSNAYKLIDILKKDNNSIKSKQNQDTFLIDQVSNLKGDVLMKQKEIDQLKLENKTLKKIKRKQESALGNHNEEMKMNLKIQQYQNQIIELTQTSKTEKSKREQNEKSFKKQHAFLVDIYNEYRFICQQSNLQPKIKFDKYNQISQEMANNQVSNNEQENEEELDYSQSRDNQQRFAADQGFSLQYQKQVSEVISMPFTQQNFMKLKEMTLYALKNLDEISQQQKKEQRQKQIIIQNQEQQRNDHIILQQSLNKQKQQQTENQRIEQQSSDESQKSQRASISANTNRSQKDSYVYKNEIQQNKQVSSRQSTRINKQNIDIINEEDFESSQKVTPSKEINNYQELPKKQIETDSGHKSTNFLKIQKQEKVPKQNINAEQNSKAGHKRPQLTIDSSYLNDQSKQMNQNEEAISEISMSSRIQINLKEAFVGERYSEIDGRDFNDRTILKRAYDLKIVSLCIYLNKDLGIINGIRCDYVKSEEIDKGEQKIIKGKDNLFSGDKTSKVKIQMDQGDYLQNLTVLYDTTDQIIRQITFISAHKKQFVVGDVDSTHQKRIQKQQLDINQDEYPVCLFGTLKPIPKSKLTHQSSSISDYLSCISLLGFQICSSIQEDNITHNNDYEDDDNLITHTVNYYPHHNQS